MTMEVYVEDALLILVFVFPRTCGVSSIIIQTGQK